MPRRRAELQEWYRTAMRGRIAELEALVPGLRRADAGACAQARAIGQALRGSGATFGFPRISDEASLVETSTDAEVLRRVHGFIGTLVALVRSDRRSGACRAWLASSTDVSLDGASAIDLDPLSIEAAWTDTARRAGVGGGELAAGVAAYFGLGVADLGSRGRAALRLVPEAVAVASGIVPLREDSHSITVATADPTALTTELQLARLTGRTPRFEVAPPESLQAVLGELYGRSASTVETASPGTEVSPTPDLGVEDIEDVQERALEHAPADDARGSPRTRSAPERPAGVLVVDDDVGERLVLRSILEKRGYPVVEAGDGEEALDVVLQGTDVGLVVADLNMPRMDGLELIWELRDVPAGEHLPVIVVTGEVDEVLETQLIEEGADDYIRKPVDPRLFLARVDATLRRAES